MVKLGGSFSNETRKQKEVRKENRIKGRCFALSGSMYDTRQCIEYDIVDLGGYVDSSVKTTTNVLVQAKDDFNSGRMTTKRRKALKYGIEIITDIELCRWILHAEEVER